MGRITPHVRDHIPLEQGLRHYFNRLSDGFFNVRDHIPLEQGLRQRAKETVRLRIACQRPYSIRTRIKTPPAVLLSPWRQCQRPYSIRTRIKTPCCPLAVSPCPVVRDHIPLEQGLRLNADLNMIKPHSVRDHIPLEQGLRPLRATTRDADIWSETIFH